MFMLHTTTLIEGRCGLIVAENLALFFKIYRCKLGHFKYTHTADLVQNNH